MTPLLKHIPIFVKILQARPRAGPGLDRAGVLCFNDPDNFELNSDI